MLSSEIDATAKGIVKEPSFMPSSKHPGTNHSQAKIDLLTVHNLCMLPYRLCFASRPLLTYRPKQANYQYKKLGVSDEQ